MWHTGLVAPWHVGSSQTRDYALADDGPLSHQGSPGCLFLNISSEEELTRCREVFFITVLCLVAQLCPTFCNPIDCSPPGSSVHGDSSGKNNEGGCSFLLQGIFPTQGSNPGLLHCRLIFFYQLSYQESPFSLLDEACYSLHRVQACLLGYSPCTLC